MTNFLYGKSYQNTKWVRIYPLDNKFHVRVGYSTLYPTAGVVALLNSTRLIGQYSTLEEGVNNITEELGLDERFDTAKVDALFKGAI